MLISYGSSDVCSSDLPRRPPRLPSSHLCPTRRISINDHSSHYRTCCSDHRSDVHQDEKRAGAAYGGHSGCAGTLRRSYGDNPVSTPTLPRRLHHSTHTDQTQSPRCTRPTFI